MKADPSYLLEQRAEDERKRLLISIADLKSGLRERLDVKRNGLRRFIISGIIGSFALLVGYGVVRRLTRASAKTRLSLR